MSDLFKEIKNKKGIYQCPKQTNKQTNKQKNTTQHIIDNKQTNTINKHNRTITTNKYLLVSLFSKPNKILRRPVFFPFFFA